MPEITRKDYKEMVMKKGCRINYTIPLEVYQKAATLARELNLSLNDFAREALQDAIEALEQERLEREIEEGCRANYNYFKQEAEAWGKAECDLHRSNSER